MYDSQRPSIFSVAPLQSIASRCRAHDLASAFLSSPSDCGQRPVELAAAHAASSSTSLAAPLQYCRVRCGGSSGHGNFLEWVPPRQRFVRSLFGRIGFLDVQLAGNSEKQVSDKPDSVDPDDVHHFVHHLHFKSPLVIGVASMIVGTGIGAGIVIALSAGQRVERDVEEWPVGEATGSRPFVPFTGLGNRMSEDDVASPVQPQLAVASEVSGGDSRQVQDAAWDEELARRRASEESQKKAEKESRSKAKAKQRAEEEARLKAEAEVDARHQGFPVVYSGASPASAASQYSHFVRGASGLELRTGRPKHDGAEQSKKKKKKRRKKKEEEALMRLADDIATGSAAVAFAAGTAVASTVNAATDHLVDAMKAAEDEFRTSQSGSSSGEDDEEEEYEEQDEEEDEEKEAGAVAEGDAPPGAPTTEDALEAEKLSEAEAPSDSRGAPIAEGADDAGTEY